jgi:hypothetical protein
MRPCVPGPDGWVVPRSVYQGFGTFSFGRKRRPSPLATALLLAVLHRIDDLAGLAGAVDVSALASSKAGRGHSLPPPAAQRQAQPGEPQVIAGRPAMKPAPPLAWRHRHDRRISSTGQGLAETALRRSLGVNDSC